MLLADLSQGAILFGDDGSRPVAASHERQLSGRLTIMSRIMGLSVAAATIALISSPAIAAPQSWSFVQSVGGLLVGDAVKANGRWSLTVQADVSGLSTLSTKPTQVNSGMACSKVEAVIEGRRIFLTINTTLASSSASARCPDAELGSPVAGKYTVFYRGPNAEPVMLKEVDIGL